MASPLETSALQIALQPLPLLERSLLVVREISVFCRPAPGRRQEKLLPVIHPQLGHSHLIALYRLLTAVARKLVRERFERVSDSRARVS